MSLAPGRSQSATADRSVPHEALGSLRGCLVEGDSEQLARERRIRRKALAISVVFQVAVLAALVLLPVFGTAGKIALGVVTPMPPYPGSGDPSPRHTPPRGGGNHHDPVKKCVLCPPTHIPPKISNADDPTPPAEDGCPGCSPHSNTPYIPGTDWLLNPDSNRPRPPVQTKHRVKITTIEPAMLLHRVEPIYPPLARQIHREGRVELRAIIATDGTIQSLEVLSGDPMFFQSALDAVRQWRYRPTILNGVPVEVETRVAVIYTLQH